MDIIKRTERDQRYSGQRWAGCSTDLRPNWRKLLSHEIQEKTICSWNNPLTDRTYWEWLWSTENIQLISLICINYWYKKFTRLCLLLPIFTACHFSSSLCHYSSFKYLSFQFLDTSLPTKSCLHSTSYLISMVIP